MTHEKGNHAENQEEERNEGKNEMKRIAKQALEELWREGKFVPALLRARGIGSANQAGMTEMPSSHETCLAVYPRNIL